MEFFFKIVTVAFPSTCMVTGESVDTLLGGLNFVGFDVITGFLFLLPSVGFLFEDTELELELCIALGVRVEVTFCLFFCKKY